jgi:hypothetical protein
MIVKLSGHTVLLGRQCGGVIPSPVAGSPLLEPEKPRRTPRPGLLIKCAIHS